MGSIRTLLAFAVVFTHAAGEFVFVGGQLAVQLFYIISGFLISYILTETKSYTSVTKFYLNRFLRLFPIYWIVAIAALLMWTVIAAISGSNEFFEVYRGIDQVGFWSLILSNIVLFGQDWIMFTGVRNGTFQFVTNFYDSEIRVWKGLLVPQAWTLGVELSFYLIAPFILHRRILLFVLLGVSLSIRALLIKLGLGYSDPWTYRFFPAELAYFLAGALSHQILKPIYEAVLSSKMRSASFVVTFIMLFYCIILFMLPHRKLNILILTIAFVLVLPLLFEFQSKIKWDRKIGDLSYPVYITHVFVMTPVEMMLENTYAGEYLKFVKSITIALVTLLVSVLLERFVSKRIEMMRARVKSEG